jgi:hypothetical protein
MEHRRQLEIDSVQRAGRVLDAAETFVGAHCGSGIGVFGRQVGAHHVDAVERGFGGDAEGVLGEPERVVGDADLEMLGHVTPSQHCSTAWLIAAAPLSGLRVRGTRA